MKTIRSVLKSIARAPLKSTLTLLTVGLGVGVLIFALSISAAFTKLFKEQLESEGIVVMVANAEIDATTGEMEQVMPPQFDENIMDVLRTDVDGVAAVAPLSSQMGGGMGGGMFNRIVAGEDVYRIRSVTSTSEEYASLMSLEFLAGSFFTAEDVANGARKVVLSETLAEVLFGSPEAAFGKILQPPAPQAPTGAAASAGAGQNRQGPAQRAFVMPTFEVVGVFKDPGELQRTSYGMGDAIMPYTAMLPQGVNTQMVMRFMVSTVAVRIEGADLKTASAQIHQALANQYGDDVAVEVWEGTPRGESSTLEEARATVQTFSLVVNLLGFVLLVTGSIGILSIMLVEVLGRSREIALERALGASTRLIALEYFTRSLILSGLSAVVGVVLSLAFAVPLKELVLPIFKGVSSADLSGSVIGVASMGTGVASALLIGGVFGIFPVIPALRTNIADGMREA